MRLQADRVVLVVVLASPWAATQALSATWVRTYDPFPPAGMVPTADGGMLLCGEQEPDGHLAVVSLDPSGEIRWQRSHASPGSSLHVDGPVRSVLGGIALAGTLEPAQQPLVVRLDSDGAVSWALAWDDPGWATVTARPSGGYMAVTSGRHVHWLSEDGVVERQVAFGDCPAADACDRIIGAVEAAPGDVYVFGTCTRPPQWSSPGPVQEVLVARLWTSPLLLRWAVRIGVDRPAPFDTQVFARSIQVSGDRILVLADLEDGGYRPRTECLQLSPFGTRRARTFLQPTTWMAPRSTHLEVLAGGTVAVAMTDFFESTSSVVGIDPDGACSWQLDLELRVGDLEATQDGGFLMRTFEPLGLTPEYLVKVGPRGDLGFHACQPAVPAPCGAVPGGVLSPIPRGLSLVSGGPDPTALATVEAFPRVVELPGCDNCPGIPNDQSDVDEDGVGDACDTCPEVADDQADADGDGVGDLCDVCVDAPDPAQEDGDGDGIGDACDACPGAFDPGQFDCDGDGVGDACQAGDADGDGVPNDEDACPCIGDPSQVDADADGLGDACDPCPTAAGTASDSDGDGWGDACDNCPGVANADQADGNGDGRGDACRREEPSALDLRPGVAPLRVIRPGPGLLQLSWEHVAADVFDIHVGTLRMLALGRYDHARATCGVPGSAAVLPAPAEDVYVLVIGRAGASESSYGRDSLGRERPVGVVRCP